MIALWILAALGVAPALVAGRSFLVERREGLRRSRVRLAVTSAIAVMLIGLLTVTELTGARARAALPAAETSAAAPARPPAPPSTATAAHRERIAALRKQIDDRRAEVERELAPRLAEITRLTRLTRQPVAQPPVPRVSKAPEASDRGAASVSWPLVVGLILVLCGFVALLLGDPSTLVPKRPQGVGHEVTVGQLARLAAAGDWRAGLDMASKLRVEQLSKLDVLDALFVHALCAVMVATAGGEQQASREERAAKLGLAQELLARLLELAPHMAEARWLSGYMLAKQSRWEPALDSFRAARSGLDDLPFDHQESVCLLHLAEARLAAADNDGAQKLFEEVANLRVLAKQIPVVTVTHRLLAARHAINAADHAAAAAAVARVRATEGLEPRARVAVDLACDVYEIAIGYRAGRRDDALAAATTLLERWKPDKLPAVEDQVADERLLGAVDPGALGIPAELYRAMYFLEAVIRIEIEARRGRSPDPEVIEAIATALLRALQFEPGQRDALFALGALYHAFRPARSSRALTWMRSALDLGLRSKAAHALYAEVRRAEVERVELLAMFRSTSARFLADPALGSQVRGALIEELGRFEEFRPVVVDLQSSGALDVPAVEVTLDGLRERAAFVGQVAAQITGRADPATVQQLQALHGELTALTTSINTSATRIAALERAVMEQLGQFVLR